MNSLYLSSQSSSRKKLLQDSGIPFKIITHSSDEQLDVSKHDFFEQVLGIAQHKMLMTEFPSRETVGKDVLFVMTADSLVRVASTNEILGKPQDTKHAEYMLRLMYDSQVEIATACCLERRLWDGRTWEIDDFRHWVMSTKIEFWVPEDEREAYLKNNPEAMFSAGAGILEGKGQKYFKSCQGSYTAALGLPMFELQRALNYLLFYTHIGTK